MFESQTDRLDELKDYEFRSLIEALDQGSWEDYTDEHEEKPPTWIVECAKHLETDYIYSLTGMDPIWTYLNGICDRKKNCYYLYTEGADYTFITKRVDTSDQKLSGELLWPSVKEELRGIGDSVLYGEFDINPSWISADNISNYLRDMMKSKSMTLLEGGKGPTLEEWLAEKYSK
jgi:hypothetical protein